MKKKRSHEVVCITKRMSEIKSITFTYRLTIFFEWCICKQSWGSHLIWVLRLKSLASRWFGMMLRAWEYKLFRIHKNLKSPNRYICDCYTSRRYSNCTEPILSCCKCHFFEWRAVSGYNVKNFRIHWLLPIPARLTASWTVFWWLVWLNAFIHSHSRFNWSQTE